ncbi:hypothetical protein BI315_14110 [Xanthomonas citri pv. citri]|nr:hypothetical protein XAC29_00780 [Xanthomonas axonopodis Xac29-1]APR08959.1 hypothetical protein BI314_00785 [Xanthomonas citri pv. citri]APR15796.1 hypothetical protein BI315_14110 [Xanthomonas citri pv. citri]APR18531.1 hypothetical protein BI316_02150 [Xanthomonas citri pv. citri]APR25429.1 hypothetical protein BJD09_15785 [Xanthomonas citri pv. citri]
MHGVVRVPRFCRRQCASRLIRCRKIGRTDAACASVPELDHAIAILAKVKDVEGLCRTQFQPIALQLPGVQSQGFEIDADFRRLAVMCKMRVVLRDVTDRIHAIVVPVVGIAMWAYDTPRIS